MAQALLAAKEKICLCEKCQNLTDVSPCAICSDARRDHATICVVESPKTLSRLKKCANIKGFIMSCTARSRLWTALGRTTTDWLAFKPYWRGRHQRGHHGDKSKCIRRGDGNVSLQVIKAVRRTRHADCARAARRRRLRVCRRGDAFACNGRPARNVGFWFEVCGGRQPAVFYIAFSVYRF